MSNRPTTKIFGIRVNADPKILVGALIAATVGFVWFQLRDSGDDHPANARPAAVKPAGESATANRQRYIRRGINSKAESTLKLTPVDPTRGDIDPTLRLDLLSRLRQVQYTGNSRNLFESGPSPELPAVPQVGKIMPKPMVPVIPPPTVAPPVGNLNPVVNIPFRYYGFVKPGQKGDTNRGFFMEGDNILVATEGDVLEQKYLVVSLTATTARVEDIQLKQGQDLQFTPEAPVSQ